MAANKLNQRAARAATEIAAEADTVVPPDRHRPASGSMVAEGVPAVRGYLHGDAVDEGDLRRQAVEGRKYMELTK